MEPFRNLLTSKESFKWSQDLQNSFEAAKTEIASQIQYGVKTYVEGKPTALVTDWSRTGIGYVLVQKHCRCMGLAINCCNTGWRIVCIGSRFLTKTEANYSAVKGELLGVVWALEKTKLWTLGDKQLTLFTDHKPLLGLLGNRSMDDIPNPELQRLAEKTLRWNLQVCHVPGLENCVSDALSRYPWSPKEEGEFNVVEDIGEVATMDLDFVSTADIKDAAVSDDEVRKVMSLVSEGKYDDYSWKTLSLHGPDIKGF